MRKPLPTVCLTAALVATAALGGCNAFNGLYKKDTGSMEPVAAPGPAYTPIATQDQDAAGDPGGVYDGTGADPDAAPEVLAGEGPDAIQPLDEGPAEVEVLETYVVEKGDTLGHISQKLFGTIGRTKDLMNANPGIDPKRMQIGDAINVPR